MSGGDGADTIISGLGDDVLTGGAGSDKFAFGPGFRHDRIGGEAQTPRPFPAHAARPAPSERCRSMGPQ
jgi:hypothetical protein